MAKRALITGITGQDGAYLAELLIGAGYEVFGARRRSASADLWRLRELGVERAVELVPLELLEPTNIHRTLERVRPDEVYNFAAQSFVGVSFEQPIYTSDVDALGPLRLLEAIRTVDPDIRFYQASTSEMFGQTGVRESLHEGSRFHPRSPYGVAKLYGHWISINYREAFGLHTSSGLVFNHESPLRGEEFVSRKVTASLARIRYGQQEVLTLGNLDARRDWGYAKDYVRGMWLMLQQPHGAEFVLATGESHSVRDLVDVAARHAGLELVWRGEGVDAEAVERVGGQVRVRIDPELYRPAEVDNLVGDAQRARERLGWEPTLDFDGLVELMVRRDLDRASRGLL